MSWEDQGRQEHGWFGHGTAPPKLGADGNDGDLRRLDATNSAEAAAARAGAWAKAYGPTLFGLPRSGTALDAFADAVTRREQDRPGSVAQALGRWAAQGKFGERARAVHYGLLTLVRDGAGAPSPGRSPAVWLVAGGATGRGQPDKTWNDSINQDPHSLAGKSAQEIVKEFTDHGYPAALRPSGKGSQRALVVDIGGGSKINQVRIHPGGGTHGGAYIQFLTDHGKLKYIDPTTYERTGSKPETAKFFDARTRQPIDQNSLRIRGSDGAAPGGTDGPVGSPEVPLEGEPPGTVRPPLGGGGGGGPTSIPGTTPRPAEEE